MRFSIANPNFHYIINIGEEEVQKKHVKINEQKTKKNEEENNVDSTSEPKVHL